jgi:hypothetical protein
MFDSNFELKLAQLADARLQERVPALYPFRVGFQLIDKSEDDTKGVGVMAFVVDGMWVYVPAFFIKGRLKGQEMMYMRDMDLMTPLNDGWFSLVRKGRIKSFGVGVDRAKVKTKKPDLIHLMLAPHEKISEEADLSPGNSGWLPPAEPVDNLIQGFGKLGSEAFMTFARTMENKPDFANAVLKYYSPDDLRAMAKAADEADSTKAKEASKGNRGSLTEYAVSASKADGGPVRESRVMLKTEPSGGEHRDDGLPDSDVKTEAASKSEQSGGLDVINGVDDPRVAGLSDDEKAKLIDEGVLIRDSRRQTTQVYNSESNNFNFTNPAASGIYNVLMQDGTTAAFLILRANVKGGGSSHGNLHPTDDVFLISTAEPEKGYHRVPAKQVHVTQCSRLPEAAYDKLKNVKAFDKDAYLDSKGQQLLLVDLSGDAALVHLPYGSDHRSRFLTGRDVLPACGCCAGNVKTIRFTGANGKLRVFKGELAVPTGTVYYKMYEGARPFQLGDSDVMIYHMGKQAGLKRLKVYADRSGFSVESPKGGRPSLSKLAAMLHLARDCGIRKEEAEAILLAAERKGGGFRGASVSYMLKMAEDYTSDSGTGLYQLQRDQPGSGARMSTEQAPLETTNRMMPAQALNAAMDASNQGVKEVMDTSILAALAGTSKPLEATGGYLQDLTKAMDRLGRMLFLFYWHNDKYAEQFGTQSMSKLEDSLRSVFATLGDLILFLKEKSTDFDSLTNETRGSIGGDLGDTDSVESMG